MQIPVSSATLVGELCFRVFLVYPLAGGIAGTFAAAMLYWPVQDSAGLLLCLLYGVAFGLPAGFAAGLGIVAPLWNACILPSCLFLITGVTAGAGAGVWLQPDSVPALLWFALLGFLVAFIVVFGVLLVNAARHGKRHEGVIQQAC